MLFAGVCAPGGEDGDVESSVVPDNALEPSVIYFNASMSLGLNPGHEPLVVYTPDTQAPSYTPEPLARTLLVENRDVRVCRHPVSPGRLLLTRVLIIPRKQQ